jgi:hypothetical protein
MEPSGTSSTAPWRSRGNRRYTQTRASLFVLVRPPTRSKHIFGNIVPIVLCVVAGCGDLGYAVWYAIW